MRSLMDPCQKNSLDKRLVLEYREFYDEIYLTINEMDCYSRELEAIERFRTTVKLIEFLANRRDYKSILDIGSAEGHYGIYLSNRGFDYTAADISATCSKKFNFLKTKGLIERSSQFIICDAKMLPIRDLAFDISLLGEILEHELLPERVIDEAMRVSRVAIFTVPILTPGWGIFSERRANELASEYNSKAKEIIRNRGIKDGLRWIIEKYGAAHVNIFTKSILKNKYFGKYRTKIIGINYELPIRGLIKRRLPKMYPFLSRFIGIIERATPKGVILPGHKGAIIICEKKCNQ